jgi:hypothetical protein
MTIHRSGFTGRSLGAPLALCSLLSMLAGCALAPPAPSSHAAPTPAFAQDSGLVFGTLSYNYAGTSNQPHPMVVHFQRLDRTSQADYALAVSVDDQHQSGVFTGALPVGVYAFREAGTAERHFAANGVKMPFEVQAGAVQDVGHYALSPITGR